MNQALKTNPEFEEIVPPMGQEEFEQLEKVIVNEGRMFSPIITWDGFIVDGHRRYKVLEKHPEIDFTTFEKHFNNRYEAISWICENQISTIKQIIGDQEDATVMISFDARVEFKSGASDEDKAFMGTPVMSAGKISADANAADPDSFAELYEGSLFKKVDTVNIIGSGFASPIMLDETWEHYVVIFYVFAEDLSDGIFDEWNFCLSQCKGFDAVEKIMFRNTGVYAGEDDGQATPVPATLTPSPTPEATAEPTTTPESTNAPTATPQKLPLLLKLLLLSGIFRVISI